MPVFLYFLIVGPLLGGLLFYADNVMVPVPLPFSVSQSIGLPEPYKAPVVVAEVPKPEIIATPVEPPADMKKLVKVVRKHKPTGIVRQATPQGRYAVYPAHEYGSIW